MTFDNFCSRKVSRKSSKSVIVYMTSILREYFVLPKHIALSSFNVVKEAAINTFEDERISDFTLIAAHRWDLWCVQKGITAGEFEEAIASGTSKGYYRIRGLIKIKKKKTSEEFANEKDNGSESSESRHDLGYDESSGIE